jgi:hypothetical protein
MAEVKSLPPSNAAAQRPHRDDLMFSGRGVLVPALVTTALGTLGTVIGFVVVRRDTYFAYLAAFAFVTSIVLGSLIFLMISYAVGAKWSVVLRRLNESIVSVLPLLALLFVPLAFGLRDLYLWMDPAPALSAPELALLHHRQRYLNPPFFLARAAVYFVLWSLCGRLLERWSLRKDALSPGGGRSLLAVVPEPERAAPASPPAAPERSFSAALLAPVSIALTFAAFDWLMSLEPLWASSLYGVYYFAGGFVASFGLLALLGHFARQSSARAVIRPPHFHALGRLMLGFTVFWAYCAFFQAMLIQMANEPAEVSYYVARSSGGFGWLSLALGLSRFVLPFFVLLPRAPKFRSGLMAVVGAWIVLGQYLDVLWLILPAQSHAGPLSGLWYLSALCAVGGACVAFAALRLRGKPLVPVGDPSLAQSIAYRSPT